MGLDAPSTDLTGRIRALRKAGVANGDIEPALPGEHVLHGRGGVDIERLSAAHAARDRRVARMERPANADQVEDFVYLEGEEEALRLSPEDGGEAPEEERVDHVEDAEAIAEGAALPDEVDEPFDLGEEPPPMAGYDPDPVQSDAVQAEILARVEELHARLDGQDTALLLLAKAIMDGADDHENLAAMLVDVASILTRPKPGRLARLWNWLRTSR